MSKRQVQRQTETTPWNTSFGGASYDRGFSIIEASNGDLIIAGETESYGAGQSDAYLLRVDQNGTLLWNTSFGGPRADSARAVIETSGGDLVIAGSIELSRDNHDYWIIRVNATGHHIWNQSYGGPDIDYGRAIIECSDSGFAVAGQSRSYPTGLIGENFWLLRLDTDGTLLWNSSIGGTGYDACNTLLEVSTGGFLLTGYTTSYGSGMEDIWVLRVDPTGQPVWNCSVGGTGTDYAWSAIERSDGNFAVIGTTRVSSVDNDILLAIIDANGNLLTSQQFGSSANNEYGYSIVETSSGTFTLLGRTNGLGAGGYDAYLIHTDQNGLVLWETTLGGAANDTGYAFIACSWGGYAITGETESYGSNPPNIWLCWCPEGTPATALVIPGFPREAIILGISTVLGLGLIHRRQRRRRK
ncbi:MAG: hypothetical protein ACFFCO_06600 [Promethearchaeota archaeon]